LGTLVLAYHSFAGENCAFEETGLAFDLAVVVILLVDVGIFDERGRRDRRRELDWAKAFVLALVLGERHSWGVEEHEGRLAWVDLPFEGAWGEEVGFDQEQ
jgi:hypothetical protein